MIISIACASLTLLLAAAMWRAAQRRGLSPAALILLAVPLAALPAVASLTAGAWQFRYALSQIAASGSGGTGVVAAVAQDAVRSAALGVAAFAAFLIATTVLALRKPRTSSGVNVSLSPRATTSAMLVAGAAVAVALTAGAVVASERAAAGTLARISAGTSVTLPPPARYEQVARGSTQQWIGTLSWLSELTTKGGLVLLALLIGGARLSTRSSVEPRTRNLSRALAASFAVASIGLAGLYLVALQPTLTWLSDLVALSRS